MIKIDNTFDSHVHFFGVGIPSVEWFIPPKEKELQLPSQFLNSKLIQGFGIDPKYHKTELKKICAIHPQLKFFLSFKDGHSSFVSSNLLKETNFTPSSKSSIFDFGAFLKEEDRDNFSKLLPKKTQEEYLKMALYAQNFFINRGIKKVRHLTGIFDHWKTLKILEERSQLFLKVEIFFSEFLDQNFNEAILSFNKSIFEENKSSNKLISSKGLKIFYDGTFGNNTAFVSSNTSSLPRIKKSELFTKMKTALCDIKCELAIHTIGDLALRDCIELYQELQKSSKLTLPKLHLEHAPIFSQSTLNKLSSHKLNCIFHFQPSHWIDDIKWYEKNKNLLLPHKIYPFNFLKEHGYSFYFGSDAPVSEPSKDLTQKGLKLISQT